jgi:hypothetical protein
MERFNPMLTGVEWVRRTPLRLRLHLGWGSWAIFMAEDQLRVKGQCRIFDGYFGESGGSINCSASLLFPIGEFTSGR